MKKSRNDDARLMALRLLGAVLDDGVALAEAPENTSGDPRNRAYARHLAYGVLRWLSALEWLASQLLNKPLKQKDRDMQRLILLGLFQLWKDDTAGHAAVHETAECAKKLRKSWATGLINAVLRRFQREQETLLAQLDQVDERFAHPQWLLQALREDWPEDWQSLVRANNQAAPLWLRLNQAFDRPSVTAALQDDELVVTVHESVESAFKVEPSRAVKDLPGFSQGKFSVQDPAAQLAAGLLRCEPGQRVLDACAAPGGKTCHLLEHHPDIELLALDRSATRLRQIEENVQRLGLAGRARLLCADAAKPDDWWDGREFDRILLDAPCTATGVIRRHPEIKWLRNPAQVDEAVAAQSALLATLWPLLKPGGILLYATCSVLKCENSGQVATFLEQHPDAVAEFQETAWGRDSIPGQQILPGEMEMDGFYYASLRKQA